MEHTTATLRKLRWIFVAAGSAILGYCDSIHNDDTWEMTIGEEGVPTRKSGEMLAPRPSILTEE